MRGLNPDRNPCSVCRAQSRVQLTFAPFFSVRILTRKVASAEPLWYQTYRSTDQYHSPPKRIFFRTMCFGKAKLSQTKAFSVQWRKVSRGPLFRKVMALLSEHYALSIALSLATLFWCSLPFLKQQSITFFEIGIQNWQSSSLPLFIWCKNDVLIC